MHLARGLLAGRPRRDRPGCALPVGPPAAPGPARPRRLLQLSKAPAAAAIPPQSAKRAAFISFVKYARNAYRSDQNSSRRRSIKVTVKVKIASFPGGGLFGEKGGGRDDGPSVVLFNCASEQRTQRAEFVSSTLIVVI